MGPSPARPQAPGPAAWGGVGGAGAGFGGEGQPAPGPGAGPGPGPCKVYVYVYAYVYGNFPFVASKLFLGGGPSHAPQTLTTFGCRFWLVAGSSAARLAPFSARIGASSGTAFHVK